jgi:dihydroorotase
MNIYFQNIRLINPVTNTDDIINLHIVDGDIVFCSNEKTKINTASMQIIDGKNLIVSPGFIDIHTHFREPGFTHKETLSSGALSAANGGFTEVVCMPNTNPVIDSVIIVDYIKNKSKDFLTKIHIAAAITQGRNGETLTNMQSLKEAGVLYFTDDGSCVSSVMMMKKAFEYAAPNDYLIAQHCEEHSLTQNFSMNESNVSMQLGLKGYPNVAEEIIIDRDVRLAEYYKDSKGLPRRYHAQHLSTAGAVSIIRNAKANGARISCEVTPHHL